MVSLYLQHLIPVFFSSCNADNNVCTFYNKIVIDKFQFFDKKTNHHLNFPSA